MSLFPQPLQFLRHLDGHGTDQPTERRHMPLMPSQQLNQWDGHKTNRQTERRPIALLLMSLQQLYQLDELGTKPTDRTLLHAPDAITETEPVGWA
ncbi:hypothetical protein AVEN_134694-1 [Araneus ventricosus]|uniref:Uncharacterized protein n=1 Tax=Araneus ventricosus TaxID=182803 RepID=A0A4Y2HUT8_ARAVE|nr:hypothetical protein AVEN_134694-1 [Araneus ventricosus]